MGTRRKHAPRIDRFDTRPLSPEAAYWLGFLTSDGHVRPTQCACLTVDLQRRDAGHLEMLAQFVDPTCTVRLLEARPNVARLSFYGRDFCAVFGELGMVNPKSHRFPLPAARRTEIPHFIRGVFDADGCIGEYPLKRDRLPNYLIHFSGYRCMLEWIQAQLRELADVKGSLTPVGKIHQLCYGGRNQVKRVIRFLDGAPRLERKWWKCDLALLDTSYRERVA